MILIPRASKVLYRLASENPRILSDTFLPRGQLTRTTKTREII